MLVNGRDIRRHKGARPCPKCQCREIETVELDDSCTWTRCARCGWLGGATVGPPHGVAEWNAAVAAERRK